MASEGAYTLRSEVVNETIEKSGPSTYSQLDSNVVF